MKFEPKYIQEMIRKKRFATVDDILMRKQYIWRLEYLNFDQVYEALSSKNWGASTTLMNEIAGDTGD